MNAAVVLVEPENAGNVGSVARVMTNFGLKELVVVNPACDLKSDECRKLASRAYGIVEEARIVSGFEKALEGFDFVIGTTAKTSAGYDVVRQCYSVREFSEEVKNVDGRIALVFGRESTGLTNEELAKCDVVLTIPTSKQYSALNLSHAVAVVLYELFSAKQSSIRKADSAQKKALLKSFNEFVDSLDGLRDKDSVKRMFANVVNRSLIAGAEAGTLTGVFKKAKKS